MVYCAVNLIGGGKLLGIRTEEILSTREAGLMSPLQLAFLGDTVWELMVRSHLVARRENVHHLHQHAVLKVKASAQSASLRRIEQFLTNDEKEIVRRGRNAHARHPAPKHQEQADYQAATGFETLMGYLYLTGQEDRIRELYLILENDERGEEIASGSSEG